MSVETGQVHDVRYHACYHVSRIFGNETDILTFSVQMVYETLTETLRFGRVWVCENDVDVVAFWLAPSISDRRFSMANRNEICRTYPPTIVETHPGSTTLSSSMTTRPISSTSALGILYSQSASIIKE